MKTSINKSKVMKRAWVIFRGNNPYSYSFSDSLRRAWFVEKEVLRGETEKAERENQTIKVMVHSEALDMGADYQRAVADYYRTAPAGTYFGD